MKPYVYIPYPQCLYRGTTEQHETCTVHNESEHRDAVKDGWITGGELHGYPGAGPAFPELVEQMAAEAKAAADAEAKAKAESEESRKDKGKAKA